MSVMQVVTAAVLGLIVLVGGGTFALIGVRAAMTDEVTVRLRELSMDTAIPLPLETSSMVSLRQAELAGSFRSRVLLPWVNGLARMFGRMTPTGVMEDLRHQLTMAGNPLGLGPREFYGIRMALTLVGITSAAAIVVSAFGQPAAPAGQALGQPLAGSSSLDGSAVSTFPIERLLIGAAILLFSARAPRMWLRSRVRARQERMRRALPDALDMLSICADAGLGFDQALQRVSESWKSPLAVEFGRVVAEMQMGVSRQAALRNLASRTDVNELSSFVAVIIQSDQLGMSISQTLHGQAEQMRVERRHRAQEEARKMPLKMLFPMMLLMLPAMFAIVLGPAAVTLIEVFDSMLATSAR